MWTVAVCGLLHVGWSIISTPTEQNRSKRTSVVETRSLFQLGRFFHARWIEEKRWKVRNETCQVSRYDEDVVGDNADNWLPVSLRNPRL